MLENLKSLLATHSIDIEPEFNKGLIRKESKWFVGKHWQMNDKNFYTANFGDFKQGLKKTWTSDDPNYTPEEKLDFKTKSEEIQKLENEEKLKVQAEVALEVEREWATFKTSGTHPYLERKQITQLFGAKLKSNEPHDDILIVPMRDVDGKIWNYQRIYSKRLSKGDKFFLEGARIDACFHILRENSVPSLSVNKGEFCRIVLCEGFATASSVQMALGNEYIVIATFNAQNLSLVAKALFEKYPKASYTIAADNDAFTVINGKKVNVGLIKGRQAASATNGIVRFPVFKYADKKLTDFNDLHCAEGIGEVKAQIESQKNLEIKPGDVPPMEMSYSKKGEPLPPGEKVVADYILKHIGADLVKQNKAIWKYVGTHWIELEQGGIDNLKTIISASVMHSLGSRDLEAYFRTLLLHIKHVPMSVDLYQPNPFIANFQDKTLHLIQNNGKYDLVWNGHQREDYLTSVLPFKAPVLSNKPAEKFELMLERLWGGHEESELIKRLVKQVMGSCLIQAFPVIAIFQGQPGTGKSTVIKLMVKLLNRQNVCSVGLTEMHGFHMENMVAKLVNYDTDIDTTKFISDSVVKKLIDRQPIKVNRKGRAMVDAFLPAVHLFACNQLPKTLDGASKAYGRRFSIIPTDKVIPAEMETFDFEQHLLDTEGAEILEVAFKGLLDLIESKGRLVKLQSSAALIDEMQIDGDPVEQFVKDLRNGGVKLSNDDTLKVNPGDEHEKNKVWTIYDKWQQLNINHKQHIGRNSFYQLMRRKGFKEKKDKSGDLWMFEGIGSRLVIQQEEIVG